MSLVSRKSITEPSRPTSSVAPLALTAKLSDSSQKATVAGNTITITGDARNNGIAQSSLSVKLAGQEVRVLIDRGFTPSQTAKALQDALPAGFSAKTVAKPEDGSVTISIERTRAAQPTLVKVSVPELGDVYVPSPSGKPDASEQREIEAFVRGLAANGQIGLGWEISEGADGQKVLGRTGIVD